MKIRNILELIEPQVQRSQYRGRFKTPHDASARQLDYGNEDSLGAGVFSTVKKDKKDPHMVKKYKHQFNFNEDAFDVYAEYIMKNKLWENPYFPRIYNYKEIKDNDGKKLLKYQIEKLHPIGSLSEKEIEFLTNKMYKDGYYEDNMKDDEKSFQLLNMTNPIQLAVTGRYVSSITDDELKDAIKHVHNMYKNHCENCVIDLHTKNFMVRKTPYGPQLVINDPVAKFT